MPNETEVFAGRIGRSPASISEQELSLANIRIRASGDACALLSKTYLLRQMVRGLHLFQVYSL